MKKLSKILALVLALVMMLSLVACGGNSNKPANDAADDTANDSANTESTDNTADDSDTADNSGDSAASGTVGYVTDDVDNSARDKYHFVYCFTASSALTDSMMNSWKKMENRWNFDVEEMSGEGDSEAYVQGLEVVADRGDVDGFFIDCNPILANRVIELLDDFGIPYVCMFNPFVDDDGHAIAPALALDQYQAGYDSVDYYCQNYGMYWGDDFDVNSDKIGCLSLDWSTSQPLTDRCRGSEEAFLKTFPNGKIVVADGVTAGHINAETGYDLTSQLMTANTDIEYWIVNACVEDYAQGAARFVETLPSQDNILITTVGSTILPGEWDSGYDGAFKSCYAIADMAYAGPAACGLIALVDGRATFDTLWAERRADGDKATIWIADSIIMTKDNYAGYMSSYDEIYM